ncbi:unnamed protein product, partial [Polarella glacialis]
DSPPGRQHSDGGLWPGAAADLQDVNRDVVMLSLVALLALVAVVQSGRKRPRATCAVVCCYSLWLGWQLARGQEAWKEVVVHAQAAAVATEVAIHSVGLAGAKIGLMLAAWLVLFLPPVLDAWSVLSPILQKIGEMLAVPIGAGLLFWDGLTWQERGIVALFALGLAGALWATVRIWQARDTLQRGTRQFLVGAKT